VADGGEEVTHAPLWRCPTCARTFANRNQTHTCGTQDLDQHFDGKDPAMRRLFDALATRVATFGPVTVLPEKTRIAFHARMSFMVVSVRKRHMTGHFVLARRIEDPRFIRIDTLSPRNHVHAFRLSSLDELDAPFMAWAREAYAVGRQEHLERAVAKPKSAR
jgi:Domain of unknown function (DUF5655)